MIKIETEKVVESGIASRKILGLSGMIPDNELPAEYLTQANKRINRSGEGSICVYGARNIVIGDILSEEDFQQSLKKISEAGEYLHEINQKIKKLKKEWKGVETFLI